VNTYLRRSASARSIAGRLASAVLCVLLACAAGGCRPRTLGGKAPPMPQHPIAEVLATHTPALMALPGVVGTYEGARSDGSPAIVVMVVKRSPELERRIPKTLEGWPVTIEVTGEIRAMPDSGR